MSSTANMMRRRPSMFAGASFRLSADRRRRVELRQLKPAVAVPGSQCGVRPVSRGRRGRPAGGTGGAGRAGGPAGEVHQRWCGRGHAQRAISRRSTCRTLVTSTLRPSSLLRALTCGSTPGPAPCTNVIPSSDSTRAKLCRRHL